MAELTDDASFADDLDVDSLVCLELSLRLEERFGIKLTERKMKEIDSLAAVRALVSGASAGERGRVTARQIRRRARTRETSAGAVT